MYITLIFADSLHIVLGVPVGETLCKHHALASIDVPMCALEN